MSVANKTKADSIAADKVIRQIADWPERDLRNLQDAIAGLLAARQAEDAEPESPSSNGAPKASCAAGWYEVRTVRGCGPYKYLRYRQGGKKRSIYLGKAQKEVA